MEYKAGTTHEEVKHVLKAMQCMAGGSGTPKFSFEDFSNTVEHAYKADEEVDLHLYNAMKRELLRVVAEWQVSGCVVCFHIEETTRRERGLMRLTMQLRGTLYRPV